MKPRILVVGSLNMDLRLSLTRMPAAGETCLGRDYAYIPGGKGANQAVAAARLGGQVFFCGRRGEDCNGRILEEGLRAEGVDTACLTADPAAPTGLAVIPVEEGGQNRIIVLPGANMRVEEADLRDALWQPCDGVICQLEIPLETVFALHAMTRERGIPLIVDAGPAMSLPLDRLRGVEVISPNETETQAMTGLSVGDDRSALEAAQRIQSRAQARFVVLKLGGRGALLYGEGVERFYPAYPVQAVDTTAAGDAFTAALTLRYLETGDMETAVEWAGLAGALAVTKEGAQPSLPTSAELEAFRRSKV
ncbi:MAG: ribokinase [Clostridiales bacterium]|nr:ribokinase [Clostridiales bacterium]